MANYPKKSMPAPAPELRVVAAPAYTAPVEVVAANEFVAPVEVAPAAATMTQKPMMAEAAKAIETAVAPMHEMQAKARAMVEKGIVESRANFAKAKTAADEAASVVEASYSAAKGGMLEFNVKAIDAMKAGFEANFDFLKSIASATSMSQYVTLHTEFARKQFEAASAQSKELASLARKVADQTVAPVKAQVAKTFKVAV